MHKRKELPAGRYMKTFAAMLVTLATMLACVLIGPVRAQAVEYNIGELGWVDKGSSKLTIVSGGQEKPFISGTTVDPVDEIVEVGGQVYRLIDTAGMRPRSRRDTSVEVFSAMRSEKAIRRADICLLVIDIAAGITQQEIAAYKREVEALKQKLEQKQERLDERKERIINEAKNLLSRTSTK